MFPRFGQFTVGEEVAQKERLYELSSISLHPRRLSMQTAYFIVIALNQFGITFNLWYVVGKLCSFTEAKQIYIE